MIKCVVYYKNFFSSIKLRFEQNEDFVCLFCFLWTFNVLIFLGRLPPRWSRNWKAHAVWSHETYIQELKNRILFILFPLLSSPVLLHLATGMFYLLKAVSVCELDWEIFLELQTCFLVSKVTCSLICVSTVPAKYLLTFWWLKLDSSWPSSDF